MRLVGSIVYWLSAGLEAGMPASESWFHHLLAVLSWTNYLSALCLSYLQNEDNNSIHLRRVIMRINKLIHIIQHPVHSKHLIDVT